MTNTRKIKLWIFPIMMSLIFSSCQPTKPSPFKERIKANADLMARSLITKDYDTFIKYMDSATIVGLGGKKKIIEIFEKGLPGGAEIKSVNISIPSDTVIYKKLIQCTLDQTIRMKVKEGILVTRATLIGVSDDNGKNWVFISASSSLDKLKINYPYLSDRLEIMPQGLPVLE